jgi:cysteine desulfurase
VRRFKLFSQAFGGKFMTARGGPTTGERTTGGARIPTMPTEARTYLDWNATAPLRPEAREAMLAALDRVGNPSSVHVDGRAARAVVEQARDAVAAMVAAHHRRVVFTSGGTEANVLALSPSVGLGDGRPTTRLLMSATEHACVRDGHRFAADAVETLPVDADGLVSPALLAERLEAHRRTGEGRALVSVHLANNETGVIQPIDELALVCRQADALLHVDAVQAAGRVAIDMTTLGADMLALSAHKMGGPKGVGALVFGSDRVAIGDRLLVGGGQERGARAGTENVAGIAGFGAAARAATAETPVQAARQRALRDQLERALAGCAADAIFAGAETVRLPNTCCVLTPGLKAESALILFDLAGVSVSSGSACSSGKVKASHVLAAMGVERGLAESALRISLGRDTGEADIDMCVEAYAKALAAAPGRKALLAA